MIHFNRQLSLKIKHVIWFVLNDVLANLIRISLLVDINDVILNIDILVDTKLKSERKLKKKNQFHQSVGNKTSLKSQQT